MTYLLACFASFIFIGLKAGQQLNVVHGKYLAVFPTSMAMAVCEIFVMANVVAKGFDWYLVFAVGMGGATGCVCAMWLHKKWRKD